jgi:hypothetical protein
MRIGRAVAVPALLAVAAVNVLSACTPGDDSDVFPTPTPSTPEPEIHCQIVWALQSSQEAAAFDVLVLDGPEEAWIAGTNTSGALTAFYQPGIDVEANSFTTAVLDTQGGVVTSTSHAFELTLDFNGTDDGAFVQVVSLSSAALVTIDDEGETTEDLFGTIDDYVFEGEWSVRDAESVELGDGFAFVTLGSGTSGSTVELGELGSFAICYDTGATAATAHPVSAAQLNLKRRRR